MKDFFDKTLTWIKANLWLAIGILIAVVIVFFPKLLKGLTGTRRIKHRPGYYAARSGRRIPRSVGMARRRIPRSVGLTRRGVPRKQYTKGGKAKKAWQIKGSLAARRHMAQIRKMR